MKHRLWFAALLLAAPAVHADKSFVADSSVCLNVHKTAPRS
jgi:hypothetical protein